MRKIHKIFIVIFLVLLSLPVLFFDHFSDISVSENRSLACFPAIVVDNSFNTGFFLEVDKYISDRFGLRTPAVRLSNFLTFNVFNKISTSVALIGKNNWLFFTDSGKNVNDFMHTNYFSEQQIQTIADNLQEYHEWCKSQGIVFVVRIIPNKHTVYPEYYPVVKPEGQNRTELLMTELAKRPLNIRYLKELLAAEKPSYRYPLYLETDTHWNPAGAFVAYNELIEYLAAVLSFDFPAYEWSTSHEQTAGYGDIIKLMGLTTYGTTTTVRKELQDVLYKDNIQTEHIDILSDYSMRTIQAGAALPRGIVYCDSFIIALQPFLSTQFSYVEYIRSFSFFSDRERIIEQKPDVVVLSILERNLPLLLIKN